MEILSKLCGSEAKVKIMRLFLFNPDQVFSSAEISNRAKVSAPSVRHEIDILKKIGLIKGKQFFSTSAVAVVKKGKKISPKKKKEGGWQLDPSFPYMSALKALLIDTVLVKYADIFKKFESFCVIVNAIDIINCCSTISFRYANSNGDTEPFIF
jgi:hypothetical protein